MTSDLSPTVEATPQPASTGDEALSWAAAWQIRDWVARRDRSAVEVVDHFLDRIEQHDPKLRAFRHLDVEASREQARAADEAVRAGAPLGPLHGVPFAVKEHIQIKGMPAMALGTGGGGRIAQDDDVLVARLRAAGAIPIGTTAMPGMGRSAIVAQVDMDLAAEHPRNPWDLSRAPASSSAGGAAAVAAGLLPMTIGSDGGGSTRLPAAICGVIGVHTSRGRIPHVSYESPGHMLTVTTAPLARDIRDAAIAMQVIAGPDGGDFVEIEEPAPRYVEALAEGVSRMRLAWTDDYGYGAKYALPQSAAVIAAIRSAAQGFTTLGAQVEPTSEAWEDFWPGYVTLSMAYGEGARAGAGKPTTDAVREATGVRRRNWARFMKLFESYDLLLSPTVHFTAFTVDDWDAAWNREGGRYPHGVFAPTYTTHTHMFNWLGWPALSVPCGFVDGLPIGLQIIAPPAREALLYRAAGAFLSRFPRPERPAGF